MLLTEVKNKKTAGEADTQIIKMTAAPDAKEAKDVGVFVKRIISLCSFFVIFSFLGVAAIGLSSLGINNDIKDSEAFVAVAKEMRTNFENSLSFYTGDTQKIIDFLLKLRPNTEEEFITFITALENLGKELSLNLDIRTMDNNTEAVGTEQNDGIFYIVNFYGSIRDMKSFIRKLDGLPYYIKTSNIRYMNPAFQDGDTVDKSKKIQNISIEIKLFTKEKNADERI